MNNIKLIVALIITVVITSASTWIISKKALTDKTGFVRLDIVFNDFDLTRVLKKEAEKVELMRKNQLDSLLLQIRLAEKNSFSTQSSYLKEVYTQKREEFESANQELNGKYEEEIWNKINSTLNKYGEENGYSFIFGAGGSGNIMYANDSKDLTKEVVNYLNRSYAGK